MGNLIIFIVALIGALTCNILMTPKTQLIIQNVETDLFNKIPMESIMANAIKIRLIALYYSNVEYKREKIVSLLIELEKLEEPDIFYEKHDYVRSYIFNMS